MQPLLIKLRKWIKAFSRQPFRQLVFTILEESTLPFPSIAGEGDCEVRALVICRVPYVGVLTYSQTRWSSTFLMLEAAVKNTNSLMAAFKILEAALQAGNHCSPDDTWGSAL